MRVFEFRLSAPRGLPPRGDAPATGQAVGQPVAAPLLRQLTSSPVALPGSWVTSCVFATRFPPPRWVRPTVPSAPMQSPDTLRPETRWYVQPFRGSFTWLRHSRPTLRDSVIPTRARLASGCAVSLSRTGFGPPLTRKVTFRKSQLRFTLCLLLLQALPGAKAFGFPTVLGRDAKPRAPACLQRQEEWAGLDSRSARPTMTPRCG